MVCAYGWSGGRGNLRVAKTPPLQSGVGGDIIAIHVALQIRALPPPPYTHTMRPACLPLMETYGLYPGTHAALVRAAHAALGTAPTKNINIVNLAN